MGLNLILELIKKLKILQCDEVEVTPEPQLRYIMTLSAFLKT